MREWLLYYLLFAAVVHAAGGATQVHVQGVRGPGCEGAERAGLQGVMTTVRLCAWLSPQRT